MEQQSYYEQVGVAMTCRSYKEYERMFALDEALLGRGPVLDIAAGASSFTADARSRGITAYAADPLYRMGHEDIYRHGMKEIETSTSKLASLQDRYDWTYYGSLERHRSLREQSLERFCNHYKSREAADEQMYREASLPELPFADGAFGLVLCSHFLFLYHEQFDYAFHIACIREMLRITADGGEVRLYPVMTLRSEPYPHLDELLGELNGEADCSLTGADLPFIPGSTQLLRLVKRS